MSKQIIDDVESLVNKYAPLFEEKGILCKASRRYFETAVESRLNQSWLELRLDEHMEQKYYRGLRNRFRGILLRFSPLKKGAVKKDCCKEYMITVRSDSRGYIGNPSIGYENAKGVVLARVEKRLNRMLKKAQQYDPETVCRDTLWDALRYVSSQKYMYKKQILGKEKWIVECGAILVTAAIAVLFAGVLSFVF